MPSVPFLGGKGRGVKVFPKTRTPVKVEINDYITWSCLFGEFLRIVPWWTAIQKVTICENMFYLFQSYSRQSNKQI